MKIIIIIALLLNLCFMSEAGAQTTSTRIIKIEIDGKKVEKDYKVLFLLNGKWIESAKTSTGFIIPDELRREEYLTVLISSGRYKLKFADLHASNFRENWIVGVDNKPFSAEFVEPEDAKTTRFAYYILFEGIGLNRRLIVTLKKTQ